MNKTIRMVLYVLSILTVAGVFVAFVLAGKSQQTSSAGNMAPGSAQEVTTESETEDTGVAEEPTTEAAGEEVQSTEEAILPEENLETKTKEKQTGEAVTLMFTGDVLFANAFQAGYDANGIDGVITEELREQLKAADILMINNEFPFSDRGTAIADKQFVFRCSPSYRKALTELGVDVVSLANNHTLDYGKEALEDTFQTLDAEGILYGGAGDTVERAKQIQIIEVNGKKFGFLAVSRVIPSVDWKVENSTPGIFSCYDTTELIAQIKAGKEECDFLTVFPHWGTEYSETPDANQTSIAKQCMDAGANLVVGAHTHCLEGIEYINGKPVFYSLGNFIFGQSIDRSMAVEVTVAQDGETSYRVLPVYATGGVTQQMTEAASEKLYSYLQQISVNAAIDKEGKITEIQ